MALQLQGTLILAVPLGGFVALVGVSDFSWRILWLRFTSFSCWSFEIFQAVKTGPALGTLKLLLRFTLCIGVIRPRVQVLMMTHSHQTRRSQPPASCCAWSRERKQVSWPPRSGSPGGMPLGILFETAFLFLCCSPLTLRSAEEVPSHLCGVKPLATKLGIQVRSDTFPYELLLCPGPNPNLLRF